MELFDTQEYNKERQILCDSVVQFMANYEAIVNMWIRP